MVDGFSRGGLKLELSVYRVREREGEKQMYQISNRFFPPPTEQLITERFRLNKPIL